MIVLLWCSDAGYAGGRRSRRTVSSKVVFADGCQLFSQVKRQSVVAISSGEVEFYGLTDCCLEMLPFVHLLQ